MKVVEIIRDINSISEPELFSKNVLKLFAPKKLIFKSAEYTRIDTGLEVNIPKNTNAFYCSLDKDFTEVDEGKHRIYLGLSSKSLIKDFCVKKGELIGFISFEAKQNLTFNHAAKK